MGLFFCCSTVDCLFLDFIVLLCVFGNGVGMKMTEWEFHKNANITLKFVNGNEKEWKLTACKWICKNVFPVISSVDIVCGRFSVGSQR